MALTAEPPRVRSVTPEAGRRAGVLAAVAAAAMVTEAKGCRFTIRLPLSAGRVSTVTPTQ